MKSMREKRLKQPTLPDGSPIPVSAAFLVADVDTSTWRLQRPRCDFSLCVRCGRCEMFCPLQVVVVTAGGPEFDLAFCKGCGICANECPTTAITMVPESCASGEGDDS